MKPRKSPRLVALRRAPKKRYAIGRFLPTEAPPALGGLMGELRRLEARVAEIDALRAEVATLRDRLLHAPPDPRSYLVPGNTLAAFPGGWPGDETDEALIRAAREAG